MIRLLPHIAAIILCTGYAFGQTSSEHDVEHITVDDVGTYRPTKTADLLQAVEEIVAATNDFRESEDLSRLETNETLHEAAQNFAEYMAEHDAYGHQADGREPSERVKAAGYEFCLVAENIAYQFQTTGIKTPELVKTFITGWKNSPGHRRNMLKELAVETGVGVAQSEKTGVYYAVQLFARPRSAAIEFRITNPTSETVSYRVGEREYSLPGRVTRTHQLCSEPTLALNAEDAEEFSPGNGDRFSVTAEQGETRLKKLPSKDR